MQNVPKIVQERLRTVVPAARHPDADVLTAFAERSLPELERTAVLEHLARCGECRDVVALALPESEATQRVFAPVFASVGGWMSWPALRWGLVTVGFVAIAALGFLQVQRRQAAGERKEIARFEAPANPAETRPTAQPPAAALPQKDRKSVAAAPPAGGLIPGNATGFREDRLMARAQTPPAGIPRAPAPEPQAGGVGSGAFQGKAHSQFPHGPQMPTQWQQQTAPVQASPAMTSSAAAGQQATGMAMSRSIPSVSQTVEVQASTPLNTEVETSSQDLRLQAQSTPSEEGQGIGGPIGKAKPVVSAEATNVGQSVTPATVQQGFPGAAGATAPNLTQLTSLEQAPLSRWTISPTGSLQRSFDQGKTWQDVDVNAYTAPGAGFTSGNHANAVVLTKAAPARESSADKQAVPGPPPVIFRALAANGAEVWAGGSGGALYHSADAGGHWTRVMPSCGGAVLSGDIVALEFSDGKQGKVTTSTAERWITSDDGQTWQKQ